jgi:hypothetical protein
MKFVALTLSAVATALLVLVIGGIAHTMGSNVRTLAPVQVSVNPLSPQQKSDQADVRQALMALGQVTSERSLALLRAASADGTQGDAQASLDQDPDLPYGAIFALSAPVDPRAPVPRQRTATAYVAPPTPLPLPKVSVVLAGGSEGKAVIDGQLVRVGDAVGDGLVVKSIQVEAVTFASGKEVLEVRMPLERLRVLGAFPNRQKDRQ